MKKGIVLILENGTRVQSGHPKLIEKADEIEKRIEEGSLKVGGVKIVGIELL